jgi:hypothetical protein
MQTWSWCMHPDEAVPTGRSRVRCGRLGGVAHRIWEDEVAGPGYAPPCQISRACSTGPGSMLSRFGLPLGEHVATLLPTRRKFERLQPRDKAQL